MKMNLIKRSTGAVAVATAFLMGVSPMTAFAQSKEAECICETKCEEDKINIECEVCAYDHSCCEGKEEENWGPLTPDGNMNLVDDFGSMEAGGKQFITLTTKAGNYFYLIIDRDDQGDETVHFLNLVDESDLLSLMDDEEAQAYIESITATTEEKTVTEETETTEETEQVEEVTEEAPEEEKEKTNVTGIMAIVLVVAVGGIAGVLYLKSKKNKPNKPMGPDPDADYSEDEIDQMIDDDLENDAENGGEE